MPRSPLKAKRFYVYVIRLDPEVLKEPKYRRDNPQYVDGQPCVYVGMTGRTPAERFLQHKNGYKACKYAHRYGVELLPGREFSHINPKTYEDAVLFERRVARRLKRRGFAVWQR